MGEIRGAHREWEILRTKGDGLETQILIYSSQSILKFDVRVNFYFYFM